jgi:hypothetical protein
MQWLDAKTIEMEGHKIILDWEVGGSKIASSDRTFTMMKTPSFLTHYTDLADTGIETILEVGVFQGGSVVFLDKVLKPKHFSAIELSTQPLPALDRYAEESNGRVKIHQGTSQDDVAKLKAIIEGDLGGRIDFVVDDASHWYEYTRATFQAAFPYVRPGGYYFIEDWSWNFQADAQNEDHPWRDRNALANLAIDLMEEMIVNGLVQSIEIVPEMIKVKRSAAPARPVLDKPSRRNRPSPLL